MNPTMTRIHRTEVDAGSAGRQKKKRTRVRRRKGTMKKGPCGKKKGDGESERRTKSREATVVGVKPARKKLGVIYNNRKRKRRRSPLDS